MLDTASAVRDALTRRGIRCTRQRELIYAALLASAEHPTAEELHHAVRAVHPGLSLATVYNALESLVRAGLCRRLPPRTGAAGGLGGPCRFDAKTDSHVHMLTPGGQVRDLPVDLGSRVLRQIPDDLIREIESRLNVCVERVTVDIIARERDSDLRETPAA